MRERETDRLILRRWREADLEPYARICADREVMRFVGHGGPLTREESAAQIAAVEEHWERRGFGLWAAELKESGELAGFVGLAEPMFIPELIGSIEAGWRLAREHWNRGLATEGAREALDAAFGELGLDEVVAIVHPQNGASIRVTEKIGMRYDGRARHPAGMDVDVYRAVAPAG